MLIKLKEYFVNIFCIKYRLKIPYFLLMWLWAYGLHKSIKSKNNVQNIDFINYVRFFLDSNKNKEIYVLLKWSAWDYSLSYLYLYRIFLILKENNNKITIIARKRYIDILSLFNKRFNDINFLCVDDIAGNHSICEIGTENQIKRFLKIDDNCWFLDLRNGYETSMSLFNSNWSSNYENHKNFFNFIDNNVEQKNYNHFGYKYSKIDEKKLSYLNKEFSNNWSFVICNFENKSYRIAINDSIKFEDYVNKISQIAEKENLKFIINSVYNNEKLNIINDNIMITSLNFQEIIWLSEHKKIKLFISERNGLNDVFKVFYPEINQIIYYPDYYNPCVDKKIYYKLYWNTIKNRDIKDFRHLPWVNIKEEIRGNFNKTIETLIKFFVKN